MAKWWQCSQLQGNHRKFHDEVCWHFRPSLWVKISQTVNTTDFWGSIVSCFAKAIGFPEDYFKIANDPLQPDCLTQLRLIHYPASENAAGSWRAGSHTDIGCLTLLFQRDGEEGLEICPGRESHVSLTFSENYSLLMPDGQYPQCLLYSKEMLILGSRRSLWEKLLPHFLRRLAP